MGGVVLREKQDNPNIQPSESEQKNAFDYFFDNSNIFLINDSSRGGVLFELKLKKGIASPYVLCRSQSPWSPVDSLLLKVCCFSKKGFNNGKVDMNYLHLSEFNNEVNVQKEIYNASLKNDLEPICPSIVRNGVEQKDVFFAKLIQIINNSNYESPHLTDPELREKGINKINLLFNHTEITGYGFIAMEFLTDFIPLGKFIDLKTTTEKQKKFFIALAAYEMIRMYDLTQHLHGDFHLDNFMVNPNYIYLTDEPDKLGRVIIIDFGESFKITEEPKINLDFTKKNTGALSILDLNYMYSTSTNPSYDWIFEYRNIWKDEKIFIEFYNLRQNTIQLWMQNIGGNSVEPASFSVESISTNKIGGNTTDINQKNKMTKPPTYHIKNNKPTVMTKPTQNSMFPPEFAGKIKEIQQYVAMDKLANEPTK
jgi:hypothetical protein